MSGSKPEGAHLLDTKDQWVLLIYILTYSNSLSYISDSDKIISMYSKTNVLKKSSFNFIMYMLKIALWGRQRHTLNGYFLVIKMGIILYFQLQRKQQMPENGASKKW